MKALIGELTAALEEEERLGAAGGPREVRDLFASLREESQASFEETNRRLSALEQGLEAGLAEKGTALGALEGELAETSSAIAARVGALEQGLSAEQARLGELEASLADLGEDLEALAVALQEIGSEINAQAEAVAALQLAFEERHRDADARLGSLDAELGAARSP